MKLRDTETPSSIFGLSDMFNMDDLIDQLDQNEQAIEAWPQISITDDVMLKFEAQMETYESILEQGCFYCSESQSEVMGVVDYDYDHCLDVCEAGGDTIQAFNDDVALIWDEITGSITTDSTLIDQKCTQIIQVLLSDSINSGLLSSTLVADFATNLVFDERINYCFAYDPRDAMRRRL